MSNRDIIAGILKRMLTVEREIGNEELLTNLGLDSLNFIDLLVQVEEEFSVTFDDAFLQLGEFDTIGKIVGMLNRVRG
ncbi:acyl carrier protein [Paenibacillus wynnii]|uniref:Carrier domain-containing protein n=1 Tax=Paenibacillus wynnii TaxID=268407 RepID=A0A098MB17_9BACL|nr:acyl carrier protein [Paenibacillus wynnii]KGE19739.1 hypothetical protein PWYN_10610 [Paenibacillus wynnii]